MLSLESPHRGDSNEYTQYTIFNIKKKITLNYSKSAAMSFYSKGLKNECETARGNEPSVFEPPKFYCICFLYNMVNICHILQFSKYDIKSVSHISAVYDTFANHLYPDQIANTV